MAEERASITEQMVLGRYRAWVDPAYRDPACLAQLEQLTRQVVNGHGQVLKQGRNRLVRLTFGTGSGRDVVVKAFGRELLLKDWSDRWRGSKAARTWYAAQHLRAAGVGTPRPVAVLERRRRGCLAESYYISEFQDGVTSFFAELNRLFREEPDCPWFMALLETVAAEVRRMHEAGVQHNDLGNQNILLRRRGPGAWDDVQFVDLNRARCRAGLSLRQRARDLSRIYLPSDFLRVFKEMYWDCPVPSTFQRWEQRYRRAYAWHTATRAWRHPWRERRLRREKHGTDGYPPENEMWVWDPRSVQAVAVLRPKDRTRYYPLTRHLKEIAATVSALRPVWRSYRTLLSGAYREPVDMAQRLGVAVSPTPQDIDRRRALLQRLGPVPVLLRFYHHEGPSEWRFLAQVAHDLRKDGHPVSIALVQDRAAVRDPGSWKRFSEEVLDRVGNVAAWVEVGHAVNRVKWGLWDFRDYYELARVAAETARRCPGIRLMGPAAIDFEYTFLAALLKGMPSGVHFQALSHHLYVDRRGAPENRQGPFSALEKFALARALARWSSCCDDRLIVSEVNWPLKGTGVYSPVGAPYQSPGPRYNDPSVGEDAYADYMIRYVLTALCSGLVERVFWWRLVSRGFGLVDDTDAAHWRERPAYEMLRRFLDLTASATFMCRDVATAGLVRYRFVRREGQRFEIVYAPDGPTSWRAPAGVCRAEDALGCPVDVGADLVVDARPMTLWFSDDRANGSPGTA